MEQSKELAALLTEYADIFAKDDTDLGLFSGIQHTIDTGDSRPIKQSMRRTPIGFESEERDHLQSMLDNGIITASTSDWASPLVLVRKKDGGVRWCIDYHASNSVTVDAAFPLPKIEECLNTLAN